MNLNTLRDFTEKLNGSKCIRFFMICSLNLFYLYSYEYFLDHEEKKVWLPILNSFFDTKVSTVDITLSKICFWAMLMVLRCFGGYLSLLAYPCLLAGGRRTCCWRELSLQSIAVGTAHVFANKEPSYRGAGATNAI